MSEREYEGGCFCGAVRFRLSGLAESACYCHCESCRRASGAPFVAWCTVDRDRFKVTRGRMTEHASSPGVSRGFCGQCGTSMTYIHHARPNDIDVTVVTLDEAGDIVPKRHLWVQDKLPWVAIDDGLPQFDGLSGQA